ncbi:MAG: hypothetical protein F4X63_10245 [Nitrospira sp. SB0662_bin_26]|nr:hypothetical protein [Nitrospira sp. SB0662_bin_26]
MKALAGLGLSMVWLLTACAGTPHVVTQKVYTDPNREVGLQTVSERSRGKGFSHPAFLKNTDIASVLKGLYVERGSSTISLPLMGGGESERYPVFNQNEIAFFAPLLAQGFGLAQPNEVVTFYERGEISKLHEVRTSGGLFMQGEVLYVILSNHAAQTEIWQDVEEYHSPVRLQPLKQLEPQPGRLVFDPPQHMVPPQRESFGSIARGKPLQVGVRFKELR